MPIVEALDPSACFSFLVNFGKAFGFGKRIYDYMQDGYESPARLRLREIIRELAKPQGLVTAGLEKFYKRMIPETIRNKQGFFEIFLRQENENMLLSFVSRMIHCGDFQQCADELKDDYQILVDIFGNAGFEPHHFSSYMQAITSYICFRFIDSFSIGDELILNRINELARLINNYVQGETIQEFVRKAKNEEVIKSLCVKYSQLNIFFNAAELVEDEHIKELLYNLNP